MSIVGQQQFQGLRVAPGGRVTFTAPNEVITQWSVEKNSFNRPFFYDDISAARTTLQPFS